MSYELRVKTIVKVLDALRLAKEECSNMNLYNELDDLQEEIRADVRRSIWANSPRGRYLRHIQETRDRNEAWNKRAQDSLITAHKATHHQRRGLT